MGETVGKVNRNGGLLEGLPLFPSAESEKGKNRKLDGHKRSSFVGVKGNRNQVQSDPPNPLFGRFFRHQDHGTNGGRRNQGISQWNGAGGEPLKDDIEKDEKSEKQTP